MVDSGEVAVEDVLAVVEAVDVLEAAVLAEDGSVYPVTVYNVSKNVWA